MRSSEKVISDLLERRIGKQVKEVMVSVVRKNSIAEKDRKSTELWTKVVGRREKK